MNEENKIVHKASEGIDLANMISKEPWTGPNAEKLQEEVNAVLEENDRLVMDRLGYTTKEQLHEHRIETAEQFQEFVNKTVADYEARQAEESNNKATDEEERITAIIFSDPELRELYSTNKQEAILQAKIRMFENAETESVPLTSKLEDDDDEYRPRM